jgi:hypothetical protein
MSRPGGAGQRCRDFPAATASGHRWVARQGSEQARITYNLCGSNGTRHTNESMHEYHAYFACGRSAVTLQFISYNSASVPDDFNFINTTCPIRQIFCLFAFPCQFATVYVCTGSSRGEGQKMQVDCRLHSRNGVVLTY